MMRIALLVLLIFFTTFAAFGENLTGYLVPVTGRDVHGANGSIWTTELTLHNGEELDGAMLQPYARTCNPFLPMPCIEVTVPPQQTTRLELWPLDQTRTGTFLYIPDSLVPTAAKQLRVRDTSRATKGWGAEVPVVPRSDFREKTVLLDVPTDANYRVLLRVYGRDAEPWTAVVRVLTLSGTEELAHHVVELSGIVTAQPDPFPLDPSYVALDPMTAGVRASGEESVRIEIVSSSLTSTPSFTMPIWAFVSLTNNETQEVTVITPQK